MAVTFSIIIPTFNRAEILRDTLRSVTGQTFSDFEVIVVDDGSTDHTREVVSAAGEKVHYFHKPNEERAVARNFGAARANGRYLMFLDSDDLMEPGHLQATHQFLSENHFAPKVVFTGYQARDRDGRVRYRKIRNGRFPAGRLLYGNHLGCSAVVVAAELFRRHRFNENRALILFEDWELWLRIASEETIHCIPAGTITLLQHHGRSVLNTSAQMLAQKVRCFLSEADRIPLVKEGFAGKRRLAAGLNSYAALHTALTGRERAAAWRFLARAFANNPAILRRKRFFSIVKRLVF